MSEKILTRERGEHTHCVEYEVHSHWIDFKIWRVDKDSTGKWLFWNEAATATPDLHEDRKDAVPLMQGALKWDGCVNLEFPAYKDCMLHFCGPEDDPELGVMMRAVYALGPEMDTWYWKNEELSDKQIEELIP